MDYKLRQLFTYSIDTEVPDNPADIDIHSLADNCHRFDRVDHTRL